MPVGRSGTELVARARDRPGPLATFRSAWRPAPRPGNMACMRGGLSIDGDPFGERWELALELIEAGGEAVSIGNVTVTRPTGSPLSDGKIEVSIFTAWDPAFLTSSLVRTEVEDGVARVLSLVDQDPRLRSLFDRYGVEFDYRYDYGMGAVRLASIDDGGRLAWESGFEPRS